MSWRVNLRYNPDSSNSGIGNDSPEIGRAEHTSDAATLAQLWDIRDVHGEAILIGDVPVEDIEFGIEHTVNGVFDGVKVEEVSGGVDHEPTPEILGTVGDRDRDAFDAVLAIFLVVEQLGVGLQSSQETHIVVSLECPVRLIFEGQTIGLMFLISGNELSSVSDGDGEADLALHDRLAFEHVNEVAGDHVVDVYLVGSIDHIGDVARVNNHRLSSLVIGVVGRTWP